MDAYSLSANSSLQLLNEISFTTPGINTQCNLLGLLQCQPNSDGLGATRRNIGPERINGRAVKHSAMGVQDMASISPCKLHSIWDTGIDSLLRTTLA